LNNKEDSRIYRRNLPHIQPEEAVFFITYCLDGVLPIDRISQIKDERELKKKEILREQKLSKNELNEKLRTLHDFYFGKYEALLDNPNCGRLDLEVAEIAQIVKDSLHHLEQKEFELICYCIMPNHVHLIIKPNDKVLFRILQSHKSFTAKLANKKLGKSGKFWQSESFDHMIRDEYWLAQKIQYTLNNPVKAKRVEQWFQWPHSFINPLYSQFAP